MLVGDLILGGLVVEWIREFRIVGEPELGKNGAQNGILRLVLRIALKEFLKLKLQEKSAQAPP